jgi:hypothetical protein
MRGVFSRYIGQGLGEPRRGLWISEGPHILRFSQDLSEGYKKNIWYIILIPVYQILLTIKELKHITPFLIYWLRLSLFCIKNMLSGHSAVSDLPIGSIGWSLGAQNLRGLLPMCIILLTLLSDFHTFAVTTFWTF